MHFAFLFLHRSLNFRKALPFSAPCRSQPDRTTPGWRIRLSEALCRSRYSSPWKPVGPKRGKNLHIFKSEKAIASSPCRNGVHPKGRHRRKPGKLWFCFRRAEMSGVISKLRSGSRLTRMKAEFPTGSSHSGHEGSKSILIVVGKSGIFSMITRKVLTLRGQEYALLLLNSKGNEEETNQIRKRAGEKAFLSSRLHSIL